MALVTDQQVTPPWWQAGLRIVQYNWSQEELQHLDIDGLVAVSREIEANTVVINGGGVYAWYPTDVPFHFADPQARRQDPFGRCVAACKQAGLRVIPRMDFSRNATDALELHPDWFARDADGTVQQHQSTYSTCPSSPYRNGAFAEHVLREIAERYDIDGFHLNAGGFRGFCYCEHCQGSFRDVSGAAIPTARDWNDPLWLRFLVWRTAAVAANVGFLREVIQSLSRDLFFIGELMGPGRATYLSAMDPRKLSTKFSALLMTSGEAVTDQMADRSSWWVGMSAKCANAYQSEAQPILNLKASLREAGWPRVTVPPATYRFQIWQALANNAGLKLPVLGSLGPADDRTIPAIQVGLRCASDYIDVLSEQQQLADVALVWPVRTALLYGGEQAEERVFSHFYGAYNALVHSHIPFVVLDEEGLRERDLAAYRVVMLPNVATLSAGERTVLEEYVLGGGGIVASYETGRFDPEDPTVMSAAFDSILGVSRGIGAVIDSGKAYARLADGHPISSTVGVQFVPHIGPYVDCVASTASASTMHLAESRDIGGSSERYEPPTSTEQVLGTAREFGRGRVVYFANAVDRTYWTHQQADCRTLLANAIRWAAQDPGIYRTTARASVEITLYRTSDEVILYLVNSTGISQDGQEAQLVGDVEISLNLHSLGAVPPAGGLPTATALHGGRVDVARELDAVQLRLSPLREHECIRIRGLGLTKPATTNPPCDRTVARHDERGHTYG
jgi:hypothetical protein